MFGMYIPLEITSTWTSFDLDPVTSRDPAEDHGDLQSHIDLTMRLIFSLHLRKCKEM